MQCIYQLEGKLHTEVHCTCTSAVLSVPFSFWNVHTCRLNRPVSKTNTVSVILHLFKSLEHVLPFSLPGYYIVRSTKMAACL